MADWSSGADSLWSVPIGRVFGIPLRLHATFLVLAAFVGLNAMWAMVQGMLAEEAVAELVLGAFLFASVFVHELGHALVARRYGIATKEITLYPIGGVARIERIPDEPRREVLIALVGPAMSLVLGGVLLGAALLLDQPAAAASVLTGTFAVASIGWMNIVIGVFNLLPAFPMDGGRVLRAVLASRMERARATRLAARIGHGLALMLALVGLFAQPMLVATAFILFLAAGVEAKEAEVEAVLAGRPARAGMMSEFATLAPSQSLADAVTATLNGARDFPVIDADGVHGVLSYEGLLRGLAAGGASATVGSSMDPMTVTASPEEPLQSVLARMRDGRARAALVVDAGRPTGLIVPENLTELVELTAASASSARNPQAGTTGRA